MKGTTEALRKVNAVPTGAIIVLIIIVWLFVLAPWLLRSQRPVGHTGEAFDDTRVLFSGDSGTLEAAPRPRFAPQDVRHHFDDEHDADWELVDADLVDGDDAASRVSSTAAVDMVDGEIVEADAAVAAEDSKSAATVADSREAAATADGANGPEDADDTELIDDTAEIFPVRDRSQSGDVEAAEAEVFTAPALAASDDAYVIDESFTSPVDLLYPGAIDAPVVAEADADADTNGEADADAGAGESADTEAIEATEADAADAADATEAVSAEATASGDLTPEELAFAQRRLGRGGWDPEADARAGATRFQRRQRTVAGLVIFGIAAVALGIVVGSWTWWIAAAAGAILVLYLVTLRNQTKAEQELRRRRVEQLRRARLGVRNAHDEELAIPRRLRRPGAVVLEADDESPDFAFLPLYDAGNTPEDSDDSRIINRRPLRDDLSARRVS